MRFNLVNIFLSIINSNFRAQFPLIEIFFRSLIYSLRVKSVSVLRFCVYLAFQQIIYHYIKTFRRNKYNIASLRLEVLVFLYLYIY